jgi:hypothetical protein
MRGLAISTLLVSTLAGCAATVPAISQPVGRFFHAGPTSADADVVSIKWQYGFRFSIDSKSVSEVKLSCAPIPGSTFVVRGQDIKVRPDGTVVWDGPTLPMTVAATPWILQPTATDAVCEAIISRAGIPDSVERAPINFSGPSKAATVVQMRQAHEFNSKANRK